MTPALAFPQGRTFDLACLGRLAVDLYAQQFGARLEDARSMAKYLGALVPLAVAMWFRYMFQVTITGAVLLPRRGLALFKTRHPWLQALRGLSLAVSSSLAFLSLRYMPVAEFTAIVMLTPVVATLVARSLISSRVPRSWAMSRSASKMLLRCTSVGWAVRTGEINASAKNDLTVLPETPALSSLASVVAMLPRLGAEPANKCTRRRRF